VERSLRTLGAVNGAAARAGRMGAMLFLVGMTLAILVQVFQRYVMNAPLSWPEEAARYMMVWMTFLVAPGAYRDNAFVRMESLVTRLFGRPRLAAEMLVHGLIVATAVVLFFEAAWMVGESSMMQSTALGIGMDRVFLVLPISFALVVLVGVEKILAIVQLLRAREIDGDGAYRYGGLAGIE